MTTTSEQVSTTDPNQQTPVDQAVAAGAQVPPVQPDPPALRVVDLDDKEVADALAAEQAENAATAGATDNQPSGNQAQQQPNQAQQQDQGQQQPNGGQRAAGDRQSIMIPKERLDEALRVAEQHRQNEAYWKGAYDARAAQSQQQPPAQTQGGQQQAEPQQQQQPTADQRLTAIHAKQDELAAKFDNGELTFADMQKQKRDLDSQELSIREEVLQARLAPRQQQQPQGDELYLDTLTGQLEQEHPWVGVFDQVGTKNDWDYVETQARENLVARGINPDKGTIGKYELRKESAALMDKLGPGLLTDRARAKGIAIPGQQPQQQQQQQQQPPAKPLSDAALARAQKLDLRAGAPPDLSQMRGTQDAGVPSDSSIENMSDEEIGALPESTLNKVLGSLQA